MTKKSTKSRYVELDEKDQDIYSEEGREELEEEDEIDELEEGARMAECANCGKVLTEEVIEEEIDDETYRFCSERCASKFNKKLSKQK